MKISFFAKTQKSRCAILLFLFAPFFNSAVAQQNLFNIPSGEITAQKQVFYQHQLNLYSAREVHSKQHFVYGAGNGFDFGVNILNINLNANTLPKQGGSIQYGQPVIAAFTGQKSYGISDRDHINFSTQTGISATNSRSTSQLTGFYTLQYVKTFHNHSRIVVGPYLSDSLWLGSSGNKVKPGILLGYQWNLTHSFALMGDWISGRHESSVAVVGGLINLHPQVQLCLGALIPSTRGITKPGIVLELNLFTL